MYHLSNIFFLDLDLSYEVEWKMSASSKKPPSWSDVTCKQCSLKLQRQNLEHHYEVYYAGKDYRESFVASKGSLHDFLKRATTSKDETEPDPKKVQVQDDIFIEPETASSTESFPQPSDQSLQIDTMKSDIASLKEGQNKILILLESKAHTDE